jgi:hypothetical protein
VIETLCEHKALQQCAIAKWILDIRCDFDSLVSSQITLQFSKSYIGALDQRQINQEVIELGLKIRSGCTEKSTVFDSEWISS